MTTISSRLPALITYLVALFTNDPTVGGAGVTVFDGPVTTDLDPSLKLWIGMQNPDGAGPQEAGKSAQDWGGIGRQAKNEVARIHCVAEAWSGDDTLATVRDSLFGITSAVEALMLANSDRFGGNVLFPSNGFSEGTLVQDNPDTGAVARLLFDLVFTARIGGT